jgi:histidinol dehydrogenase
MQVRIAVWPEKSARGAVQRFLERPAFDTDADAAAERILADVRRRGDRAVAAYARRFDGATLAPARFRVTDAEIRAARRGIGPALRRALRDADRRVATFARAGLRRDWRIRTPGGGAVGEQFAPYDRVGVYVPGGVAPLVSTALMTATLARVAGVPEIVACTPCGPDGAVHPAVLAALDVAGATEVYRIGGVQAIGLLAFGTRTVRPVRKIVGPGGRFVTAAKRRVYGHVALDLVAGPSEIAVLADSAADPRLVAADLLSQVEHGTGWEKALLVTPSRRLAERVARELDRQTATLSRARTIRAMARRAMLLVVVPGLAAGMDLCNRFAPEHLELQVRNARRWVRRVRCAGAVFVGPWTPEAAGDFVAGPSHVLPTGGAAARFSGLTVDDFRRRTSVVAFTRRDLEKTVDAIEAIGAAEGLDAHARSARLRFEKGGAVP